MHVAVTSSTLLGCTAGGARDCSFNNCGRSFCRYFALSLKNNQQTNVVLYLTACARISSTYALGCFEPMYDSTEQKNLWNNYLNLSWNLPKHDLQPLLGDNLGCC